MFLYTFLKYIEELSTSIISTCTHMLIKFKTNAFQIEYAYFYKGFPEVRCNNVNFCQTFFESIKQWVQNEV